VQIGTLYWILQQIASVSIMTIIPIPVRFDSPARSERSKSEYFGMTQPEYRQHPKDDSRSWTHYLRYKSVTIT